MKTRKTKNLFVITLFLLTVLFLTYFTFAEAVTETTGKTSVGQTFTFPWSNATGLGALVKQIYLIALGIVGVLAFGMIVFGGIQYSMSAGDPSRQKDARDRITQALWGVILLLAAFLILNTINPDLIKLKDPSLGKVSTTPSLEEALEPLIQEKKDSIRKTSAQLLLDFHQQGKLRLDSNATCDSNTSPLAIIQTVAAGNKAPVCSPSCSCSGQIDLSSNMLNGLIQVAVVDEIPFRVTSISGGQHTANSTHYQGRAADIIPTGVNCNNWQSVVNAFKKYGSASCDKNGAFTTNCCEASHIHFNTSQ